MLVGMFHSTCTSSTVWNDIIKPLTSGMVCHPKFEVLRSIIISLTIDVMNMFIRLKIASKNFFHNKSVFKNSTVLVSTRMIPHLDCDITPRSLISSTFPLSILFASSNTVFKPTFTTAKTNCLSLHIPSHSFNCDTTNNLTVRTLLIDICSTMFDFLRIEVEILLQMFWNFFYKNRFTSPSPTQFCNRIIVERYLN